LSTDTPDYAERLRSKQNLWWKRMLHVQAPYHWNMRRQHLGRTLDVGCGIGRNLGVLAPGSVGVDHNSESIALARAMGYDAYTVKDFLDSELAVPGGFDGLLVAHVIEHMDREQALKLLGDYLPFVRPGGRVFLLCPRTCRPGRDPGPRAGAIVQLPVPAEGRKAVHLQRVLCDGTGPALRPLS
jgi:SAM-dependent methyltransferase